VTWRERWTLVLALSLLLLLAEAPVQPPARPAARPPKAPVAPVAEPLLPPPPTGGSPDPPSLLPPARACQGAASSWASLDALPGQVDGNRIKGAQGLRELRRAWGDALVVVRNGDFSGADLRGARLHNICFVGTKFVGSDWRGARARGIGFYYSDLSDARLQGARMPDILISSPQMARTDATGADFSGGLLSGHAIGTWEGLRLDKADLRRFRFGCGKTQEDQCVSYWRRVSFRGADLRHAHLDTHWGDADWTGARLSGSLVSLRQLPALAKARIEGPLIVREDMAAVRLSAAEFGWLRRHIALDDPFSRVDPQHRPGVGPWMKPGRSALFVALPLQFDAAARASPLYRRLRPAIVAGAASYVHVKVARDGTVRVEGHALGANAHWCTVSGPPLRLDRATGWYSGPAEAPPGGVGRWRGPLRPVLRLWGDQAEIYRDGHPREFNDYFTCGARAFFYEMTRIPFPAAAAKRLWQAKGA
jgi:uncharacterized protein YjbI with pentapeptide repeats